MGDDEVSPRYKSLKWTPIVKWASSSIQPAYLYSRIFRCLGVREFEVAEPGRHKGLWEEVSQICWNFLSVILSLIDATFQEKNLFFG